MMVFSIQGKVAIVTGGANGIGLFMAKELLKNGAKGVTLADVVVDIGNAAVLEIEKEYGPDKAIFVETNISDAKMFEDAFIKTIEKFKNVDILVNNAGIFNDAIWEKMIAVNVNGTVNGMLLAIEKYLPKYKQGSEAVILNVASRVGLYPSSELPIYSATKHAVISLTQSWGREYFFEKTGVRVVAICPGDTRSYSKVMGDVNLIAMEGLCRDLWIQRKSIRVQDASHLVKEAAKVIENAPNGTCWLIELGNPAIDATPQGPKKS